VWCPPEQVHLDFNRIKQRLLNVPRAAKEKVRLKRKSQVPADDVLPCLNAWYRRASNWPYGEVNPETKEVIDPHWYDNHLGEAVPRVVNVVRPTRIPRSRTIAPPVEPVFCPLPRPMNTISFDLPFRGSGTKIGDVWEVAVSENGLTAEQLGVANAEFRYSMFQRFCYWCWSMYTFFFCVNNFRFYILRYTLLHPFAPSDTDDRPIINQLSDMEAQPEYWRVGVTVTEAYAVHVLDRTSFSKSQVSEGRTVPIRHIFASDTLSNQILTNANATLNPAQIASNMAVLFRPAGVNHHPRVPAQDIRQSFTALNYSKQNPSDSPSYVLRDDFGRMSDGRITS